jgi:SAM-dependent methyltransferase
MGSGSVNFDQAAAFYDRTRRDSAETEARVTAMLGGELAGRGLCLEVGVGTGRIALPLGAARIPLVGVDISRGMLARLVEKAGGKAPFPLALADATALPFRQAAFGAAVAAHVLHLIPPWREVVLELGRVVRPGGVILVNLPGGWPGPLDEIRMRFATAGGLTQLHVGVDAPGRLDQAFRDLGATVRELPPIEHDEELRLEDFIAGFERGDYSYTWRIEESLRRRAGAEVRAWARVRYGSLAQARCFHLATTWRAYDLPSRPGQVQSPE